MWNNSNGIPRKTWKAVLKLQISQLRMTVFYKSLWHLKLKLLNFLTDSVLQYSFKNFFDTYLILLYFRGLKFRENFLGTFRESLISRSRRKIVFAGNLISRNWRLSDFIFSFLQKFYVNQQLKQNQYAVPVEVICEKDNTPRNWAM